jgi:hypothetical protein
MCASVREGGDPRTRHRSSGVLHLEALRFATRSCVKRFSRCFTGIGKWPLNAHSTSTLARCFAYPLQSRDVLNSTQMRSTSVAFGIAFSSLVAATGVACQSPHNMENSAGFCDRGHTCTYRLWGQFVHVDPVPQRGLRPTTVIGDIWARPQHLRLRTPRVAKLLRTTITKSK